MAREVNTTLSKIMAEQRGIPESKAEEIVKGMRSANQYQVCVISFGVNSGWAWGCASLFAAVWGGFNAVLACRS